MSLNSLKALLALSAVRQVLGLLMVFATITLLAGGLTYWLVHREIYSAVDARLSLRMEAAITSLAAGKHLPLAADGQIAQIAMEKLPEGFQTVDHYLMSSIRGDQFRYLAQTTPHGQIVLGENTERQEELLDMLAGGIQFTLLGKLIAAIIFGLWMARRAQTRLNVINEGLAKVAQGLLETRIRVSGPKDDLSLLVERINDTTGRLESAMTQMRVQSSNIAHDLRTPLARLRAQVETMLNTLIKYKRPVSTDDLGNALEQIDCITGTFNALLRLTQIESGAQRTFFTPVNLSELGKQIEETFGPVVEDAGQTLILNTTAHSSVMGDVDLLIQLTANLIQNSICYGPSGQTITLSIGDNQLSVNDQGPGITPSEREAVLEPLYQGEYTRQGQGFGLGLSIVRAISDLHDAELSLNEGAGGVGLLVIVKFS